MRRRASWLVAATLALAACGGDDGSASAGDWCTLAQRLEDNDTAFEGMLGDDPDVVKDSIDELRDLLDEAARTAPDEILADVNTSADGVDALAGLIEDADYDITQIDEAALAELDVLGDEMNAATDRIEQYNETECGIVADGAEGVNDGTNDEMDGEGADDGATATTDPATVETTGESDGGDTGDDGAFSGDADSAWCRAARDVQDASDALDADDFDFTDPATVEQAFGDMLTAIEGAIGSAPPEIAADVDTSYEGFLRLDEALATVDYDFLSADLSLLDELDDEMEAAGARIEQYNEDVCGIPSDSTLDDTSADEDFDPSAGSIREQTIDELMTQGFTEAEAGCIFDEIDFTDPDLGSDMNAIVAVFDACGIDVERLAELGGG